jgi:Flp pilus assembly protein TadG
MPRFNIAGRVRAFEADHSGTIAVIAAIVMAFTLGIIGLAIDFGNWHSRRTRLQAMADKAATAAAASLIEQSPASALATVDNYMFANGRAKGTYETKIEPSSNTVTVDIIEQGSRFFSVLFMDRDPNLVVSSSAVASRNAKSRLCVLAMDENIKTGVHMYGEGNLDAPNCIVWSNSKMKEAIKIEKSVNVRTARICAPGGALNTSSGVVEPAPTAGCPIQLNPYDGFSLPVPATCDFNKFTSNAPVVRLTPGTYCNGLTISSDIVIAAPGIYFIKDGDVFISGTSEVTFENATIYLSGKAVGLTVKGDSKLRMTAPADGPTKGFALVMDPGATPSKSSSFAGSSEIYFSGIMNTPRHKISISGNSSGVAELSNAMLVASELEFSGAAQWRWTAVEKLPPGQGETATALTK